MTVLVANGNAGDRSLRSPLARALGREGFAVLLFDYRGYGGNPGHPSEEGLASDVRAAYRFLTEDQGIRRDNIIYFREANGNLVAWNSCPTNPSGPRRVPRTVPRGSGENEETSAALLESACARLDDLEWEAHPRSPHRWG